MKDYVSTIRQFIGHDQLLVIGAGVFIHRDNQLLLQKRWDNGLWAEHGGCVEIGESTEAAARRELREETGLIAGALSLLGVYAGPDRFHTYPNGDIAYIVGVYYLCEDYTGTPVSCSAETTELQWFPLDQLPDSVSPLCREPLQKCYMLLKAR